MNESSNGKMKTIKVNGSKPMGIIHVQEALEVLNCSYTYEWMNNNTGFEGGFLFFTLGNREFEVNLDTSDKEIKEILDLIERW
ncbi:hypothetical protein ABD87_14835 [Lysinibacillus sphaericus]|uniref:hypothetical protein n=1 Tax=Lysinibacillus sphaericus TaxID=1421 RepID=UPI0018CFE80B|nr:hypothetical protein [Lysinibacillus sphaericus]MBG9730772.1 hypothetical protein [Lysinibacillus sphaericus]